MSEFIGFLSGMVAMFIVWYWSDNQDRQQYRIGYRDGYADGLTERMEVEHEEVQDNS